MLCIRSKFNDGEERSQKTLYKGYIRYCRSLSDRKQFMQNDKQQTAELLKLLTVRITEQQQKEDKREEITSAELRKKLSEANQLVLQLQKEHEGDIGVFSPYFLNYVRLKPGEVLVIATDQNLLTKFRECFLDQMNPMHI